MEEVGSYPAPDTKEHWELRPDNAVRAWGGLGPRDGAWEEREDSEFPDEAETARAGQRQHEHKRPSLRKGGNVS